MGYAALTAFLEHGTAEVTILDLAKRLVHFDFKTAHVYMRCTEDEDRAAELIAKLIEQEIQRLGDELATLKQGKE